MLLCWEGNADYDLPGICEKELLLSASFLMNYSNSVWFIYLFTLTRGLFRKQTGKVMNKQITATNETAGSAASYSFLYL